MYLVGLHICNNSFSHNKIDSIRNSGKLCCHLGGNLSCSPLVPNNVNITINLTKKKLISKLYSIDCLRVIVAEHIACMGLSESYAKYSDKFWTKDKTRKTKFWHENNINRYLEETGNKDVDWVYLFVSTVTKYRFHKRTPTSSSAKTLLTSKGGAMFDVLWLVRKMSCARITFAPPLLSIRSFGLCDRNVD